MMANNIVFIRRYNVVTATDKSSFSNMFGSSNFNGNNNSDKRSDNFSDILDKAMKTDDEVSSAIVMTLV